MISRALRGLAALCLLAIVFAVCFSPGLSAVHYQAQVAIVDISSLKIAPGNIAAAGQPRYDKRGADVVVQPVALVARPDGYMNWRTRSTIRSI